MPASGLIVDLLGFITGAALYVMLVAMVWRERAVEGTPFLSRRGRLPLLTGVCGLIWNLGALASFGMRVAGTAPAESSILAVAFTALGFLPAVIVHALLEGRETAAGRTVIRGITTVAYGLSATAGALHLLASTRGDLVPSRPALRLLMVGFMALTASLLVLTRHQPVGRRGIWVAGLSIFAVSAAHFSRHVGNEVWWVELAFHHASLPLALAILFQDYRFAFADLFLKNAIALLCLMGVSVAVLSGLIMPLVRWQHAETEWDPRAVAALVVLWVSTALTFPALRRLSARLVDRAVLRRPDYKQALGALTHRLDSAMTEEAVTAEVARALSDALGVQDVRVIDDPFTPSHGSLAVVGTELRAKAIDPICAVLVRLHTVEAPYRALAVGALPAGRRLLSDDLRWLETVAAMAARRVEAFRVSQERIDHNLHEEAMQRLATEAELRALRAQLNPHFLFNALTTIGYLIKTAPTKAVDTLLRLTSVLRTVLRRSTVEFCTLDEEVEFINAYLDIEQARFEERLTVTIDIASDVRDVEVPTLLLQPLVENAIKHGVAPKKEGGAVRVLAWGEYDRLRVRVVDSGVGFVRRSELGSGVGLRSVRDRLRAHYGPTATLEIWGDPGRGTTVELNLPAVHPAGPHAARTGHLAGGRSTGR